MLEANFESELDISRRAKEAVQDLTHARRLDDPKRTVGAGERVARIMRKHGLVFSVDEPNGAVVPLNEVLANLGGVSMGC